MYTSKKLTEWLRNCNSFQLTLFASLTSFCLYSCVYTFRKAFTVATFDDLIYFGIQFKVWLIVFQVFGYALSKFIGIKVVAELKQSERAQYILSMVLIAGLSWLFFALTLPPINIIFLFTNGLALGMSWGAIFNYLEGRRTTEMLAIGLSISFIFSSGMAKSVGAVLMKTGVTEFWMPFATCTIFAMPLLIFLFLLNHTPAPTLEDERLRTRRLPMDKKSRMRFFITFWPGIILFIISYILLSAFRDFRDNFASELWNTLGYGSSPQIFTTAELPAVFIVFALVGSIILIRNNINAFLLNHILIFTGFLAIGISCWLFESKIISPLLMMVAVGSGLYLAYIPFNSIFFDRMLAAFKYSGTVGFIMYLSDSFGYLGSLATLFFKEFGNLKMEWLDFFITCGYIVGVTGSVLILFSALYFYLKYKKSYMEKSINVQVPLIPAFSPKPE